MPEKLSLNPRIREAEIGIRNLRKIFIYPLSIRDQLKAKEMVRDALETLFRTDAGDLTDITFVSSFLSMITDHIDSLIPLITDKAEDGDDLISDMDNEQFANIVKIVYEVNYSFLSKTVMGFLEKAKKKMEEMGAIPPPPSTTPSLKSVSNSDIALMTSSASDSGKEE